MCTFTCILATTGCINDDEEKFLTKWRRPLHHHHHHEISSAAITIRPQMHYNVNVDVLNRSCHQLLKSKIRGGGMLHSSFGHCQWPYAFS